MGESKHMMGPVLTKILTTGFVILTALWLGCGSGKVLDRAEERAVIKTLEAMWTAVEAGDVNQYASFIHPDYTAFNEGDLKRVEGYDQEIAGTRAWLESASHVKTHMHEVRVDIEGNMAVMSYYWTDSGVDQGQPFEGQGKSTRIFKKVDGRWLCLHAHFTSVPRDSIQIETLF